MTPSTEELLKQVSFFAGLDERSLRVLAGRTRRRRFAGDEVIFREGDAGQTLYVVVSGHVIIRRIGPSGEWIPVARRGPCEPIGELALIDGKPRMADAVTAGPCELLLLDREDFDWCLERYPQIARSMLACLADRLRESADYLESYISQDVPGRVAAHLLDLLRVHGGEPVAGGMRLNVRIDQQMLARQVGTTRESVNRAMHQLRQTGAIRAEQRQPLILDVEKLERRVRGV